MKYWIYKTIWAFGELWATFPTYVEMLCLVWSSTFN